MSSIPLVLEPTLPSDYRSPPKPVPYRAENWAVSEIQPVDKHPHSGQTESVIQYSLPSIISLLGDKGGSATYRSDEGSPNLNHQSTSSDNTECTQRTTGIVTTIPQFSKPQVDVQQQSLENFMLRSECQRSQFEAEFWKGQYNRLHNSWYRTIPTSQIGFSDRPGSWNASENSRHPANIPVGKFPFGFRGTGNASPGSVGGAD